MLEWIITSCVLIGIVLLVRLCLKNRISLRLRYALWLIVLVRLLVPVNFFNSSMSVMNVVPESATVVELQQPEIIDAPEQTPTQSITDTPVSQVPILPVNPTPITPVTPEEQEPVQLPQPQITEKEPVPEKAFSVTLLLQILWITGMAVTALVFFITNIRFTLRLKRTKQPEQADCSLPVYRSSAVDTPCLFGLFKPAIYLTQEAVEDEGKHHILTHEMTHYKHFDHIWGLLRCLCLALHWYNPLVWVAAICSRRDSELACDEAVIKQLGEDSRTEYGKTLIRMTCTKQNAAGIFTTATTMTGSKKTIKNRIKLIVKHPKTALYAAICLVLVAAIAVGCTFTGAKSPEENTAPTVEKVVITDKPAAEVLTTSYKLEDLRAVIGDRESSKGRDFTENPTTVISLDTIHQNFPIECFKGWYIVYSVEEGGYFYILPEMEKEAYNVGEQIVLADTQVECAFYIPKVCSLSDYENIEVGKSTYRQILDIDSNLLTYYGDSSGMMASVSILSNGSLITIDYDHRFNGAVIVSDMRICDIQDDPFDLNGSIWWSIIAQEDWPVDSADRTLTENAEITEMPYYFIKTRKQYVGNKLFDQFEVELNEVGYPDSCTYKLKYKIVEEGAFEYNKKGQLCSYYGKTGAAVESEYKYNEYGNLIAKKAIADGSIIHNDTYVYTYDAMGNILTENMFSEGTDISLVTYTYDSYGNVLTSVYDAADKHVTCSRNYQYDTVGNVLKVEYAWSTRSGITCYTFEYENGRLVRAVDESGFATVYKYDDVGRIVEKTYTSDSAHYISYYEYDSFGRLIKETSYTTDGEMVGYEEYTYYSSYVYLNKFQKELMEHYGLIVYPEAENKILSEEVPHFFVLA